MTLTTDKVYDGMDIIDLLLNNAGESTSCHSNQAWTISTNDMLSIKQSGPDDFLDFLLHGSDSSSGPASPLWSPCTSESGINEDPLTDPTNSPHPNSCSALPVCDSQAFTQSSALENQPPANEKKPDVVIDLGCEFGSLDEDFGISYYLTANQNPLLPSSHSLTVKDLLLSNLGHKAQRIPQHSLQELVLNEDEKRLLAKEGVNLPSRLPLSKFEDRVLKKIRRKIRNKRSAQESRKKKREYVDSLEDRLSACGTHNLKLQRKIQQLEDTNNALLEQLSQLQALLPNGPSKTTQRGTCILVLLLSFSLLISSNLQPNPYGQLSQAEYAETKVPSRSLQSMDDTQEVPPPPPPPPLLPLPLLSVTRGFEALRNLTGKIRPQADLPKVDDPAFRHQDHRHKDLH
ncbi:cyclic AMP-responsive element-binding protein 3-like protein 3-B [Archocentrus centrarchus]|uniref:cyclic AMP-responsive element-binding protein 3-like protein 3-B n=1 Tax=Archocentrus centrarchus TaxID=63155 RepID=UPI0011EA0D7C|nr:cyclic AMP-responsive element-binding protein 3-like protein 3-B [Archocentrus centrarchus]